VHARTHMPCAPASCQNHTPFGNGVHRNCAHSFSCCWYDRRTATRVRHSVPHRHFVWIVASTHCDHGVRALFTSVESRQTRPASTLPRANNLKMRWRHNVRHVMSNGLFTRVHTPQHVANLAICIPCCCVCITKAARPPAARACAHRFLMLPFGWLRYYGTCVGGHYACSCVPLCVRTPPIIGGSATSRCAYKHIVPCARALCVHVLVCCALWHSKVRTAHAHSPKV
jgi:hypothetical protein